MANEDSAHRNPTAPRRVVVGVSANLGGLQALGFGPAEARRRGTPLGVARMYLFQAHRRGSEPSYLPRDIARQGHDPRPGDEATRREW